MAFQCIDDKNCVRKFPAKILVRNFLTAFRACSYGEKLSRLARKHFDTFTGEISPWYENNMKSYTAFIGDKKFSRVPRSR